MLTHAAKKLVTAMLAGERNSLARLISLVESDSLDFSEIADLLSPRLGKACCVGVTVPPGGGKSTLIAKLASTIRSKALSVGIIAVDPSSPVSGGAVLGDRIRMQQYYLDEGCLFGVWRPEVARVVFLKRFQTINYCYSSYKRMGIEELYQEIEKHRKNC